MSDLDVDVHVHVTPQNMAQSQTYTITEVIDVQDSTGMYSWGAPDNSGAQDIAWPQPQHAAVYSTKNTSIHPSPYPYLI